MVGVISDTHDDIDSLERAVELFQRFGVDEIIHLGDLVSPFTLKPIISSGIPFRILRGNNDAEALLVTTVLENGGIYYTAPVELELGGLKSLMFHGFGSKELTKKVALRMAESSEYELILYGHTHELHLEEINGSLIFNPGESSGKLTGRRTVAILDTIEKEVEIIDL
ncbi:MAG: metallophosphoesterase [Candidatus Korarchaeota archaeon]|nr:metallophosphoesterase [Candidatus Korarchaeota archaeon]